MQMGIIYSFFIKFNLIIGIYVILCLRVESRERITTYTLRCESGIMYNEAR